MEDDDVADHAQQLLFALDETLGHKKLVEMLSGAELGKLRSHRKQLALALAAYRVFHGYMKPRKVTQVSKIPSGQLQGTPLLIALGGLATTLAGFGTSTAAGVGAGAAAAGTGTMLTLGVIILPFAAAVLVDQLLGGGSPREASAKKLQEAVKNLIRDMAQIDATTKALAISAAAAADMVLEELVTALTNAIDALRWVDIVVILAELARRYPSCVHIVDEIRELARFFVRLKSSPTLGGKRVDVVRRGLAIDIRKAQRRLRDCIAYLPPRVQTPE